MSSANLCDSRIQSIDSTGSTRKAGVVAVGECAPSLAPSMSRGTCGGSDVSCARLSGSSPARMIVGLLPTQPKRFRSKVESAP